jgi:hypothetical protein
MKAPAERVLAGCVLEPLREDAEFSLYRARQHNNPLPVPVVALAAEQPSPQNLEHLECEYSLAADLDPVGGKTSGTHSSRRADGPHT